MAKLQKSLKQQQRHSQSSKPHVAKLSPAEIRSLNHNASVSPESTKLSPSASANSSSRRPSSSTPPITPDNNFHRPLPRSSTVPLPTPPRSPVKEHHRDSQRDYHHDHHHAGRSRSHSNGKAVNGYSRTSSTSSYRSGHSLHTYRGHEVTQTGNKIMLQRPQQEIVTNPLSMFSRPRQSQLLAATSPDKFQRDFLELDPHQAEAMLDSTPDAPTISSRAPSPPRMTDSPVSADEAEDTKQGSQLGTLQAGPSSDSADPSRPVPVGEERSKSDETIKPAAANQVQTQPEWKTAAKPESSQDVMPEQQQPKETTQPSPSVLFDDASKEDSAIEKKPRNARKRFTFHHAFDKKEHEKGAASDRKSRRNTLSFTKSPEQSPNPVQQPLETATSREPSSNDQEDDDDPDSIPSHPGVRPPSIRSRSSSVDPKPKTSSLPPLNTSGPTYGRCACCGKIKRPHGYGTELSPVMENEHLRTNFSLEAERRSTEARRYTPIIPIEVKDKDDAGSIRTVQATIEPYSGAPSVKTSHNSDGTNHSNRSSVSVGSNQTVMQSSVGNSESSPTSRATDKVKAEEPRIVRFSSLHGSRGDAADSLPGQGEEEIVQSVPFVQPAHQSQTSRALQDHRRSLPSQQKTLQQQQHFRHSAMPTMSGAVQRPPHPLRQSSPIDSMVDELQSLDGSIVDAQQQEIKRVPKQDIITVIPLHQQSAGLNGTPQASPVERTPVTESPISEGQSPTAVASKKLQKDLAGSSPTKSRRLSLPSAHKFRLPGARRSETIPVPYSASQPGPPPETDPALRPPLPSQTTSARTSMSSAAEARDRQAARSTADSRRTSRSQDRSSTTVAGWTKDADQQQINGIATGTLSDSNGKQIRPSPSFARFIQNLPATHASNVPEAKKFGWRRKNSTQQGVTPIAESEGEAATSVPSSMGGRTPQGGRSRAASVNGVSASGSQPLPALTPNQMSLPHLELGHRLSSTATINRLVGGEGGDQPKTGGFVGGLKLEQMLERERAVAA